MNQDLTNTVKAMAEIYGKTMTEAAARLYLSALSQIPNEKLMPALDRCMKELRSFPTIADVIARAQSQDGRPGAEEAWALIPKSEDDTVVWTEEMAEAYGVCASLIGDDDVAARMTFREIYTRKVQEARDIGRPAKWIASLGQCKVKRKAAVDNAVSLGRITSEQAKAMLPDSTAVDPKTAALINDTLRLE